MIHISKRVSMPKWQGWLIRLAAVGIALLVNAALIYALTKLNPIRVYITMFQGAFGTQRRIWNTLADTAMLLCIGVGLAPAFKMKFWNIGAEGQILVGGLASAACMIYFKSIPSGILLLIMFILSGLAGGIWGAIPAVSKVKLNTNETLFTLMMNYIAIRFTAYCVAKWENPFGSNTVGIVNSDTKTGWIGNLLSKGYNGDYLWTVLIVLVLCTAMWAYLRYSKQGYEIAVVGDSENTARYAGIRVNRVYMRTMAISGAVCGFAGFLAVSAVSHTISISTAGGRGFTAIIVAWLAKMNPFVMLLISALLTFLSKGAIQIATDFQLNEYASEIISGIVLFFILGSEFFINYKLKLRGSHKEG